MDDITKNYWNKILNNNMNINMNINNNKYWLLKTVDGNMRAYNNFQYPSEIGATITAPDFLPTKKCGNGLHAYLNGEGDGRYINWESTAKWLILSTTEEPIDLDGKVKVRTAALEFIGDQKTATDFLRTQIGGGYRIIGSTHIVGDNKTAQTGYKGTAIAGNKGTAMAGDKGTAQAGYKGTAIASDRGTAQAGYKGTAKAGDEGIARAGDCSTAQTGCNGIAQAGDYGTAQTGYKGTAIAGYYGTAQAGYKSTAQAGDKGTAQTGDWGTAQVGDEGTAITGNYGITQAGNYGIIQIKYWDEKCACSRYKTGYIGENGLKPNTKYQLDKNHNFKEVK